MSLKGFLNYMRRYPYLREIDYSLKAGDLVYSHSWPGPVEIINLNWALLAASVKLGPRSHGVVWPIWSLRREPQPIWDPWLSRYVPWWS